jgi:hypothetical protein
VNIAGLPPMKHNVFFPPKFRVIAGRNYMLPPLAPT